MTRFLSPTPALLRWVPLELCKTGLKVAGDRHLSIVEWRLLFWHITAAVSKPKVCVARFTCINKLMIHSVFPAKVLHNIPRQLVIICAFISKRNTFQLFFWCLWYTALNHLSCTELCLDLVWPSFVFWKLKIEKFWNSSFKDIMGWIFYLCIDTDAVIWHFCSSTKSKTSNESIPTG